MTAGKKRVAVVGAGITGLSAAFYLQQMAAKEQRSLEVILIEASGRFGGKVRTLHRDGCVIERGPDSFLARKQPIIELTRELGLEDELTAINPEAKTFIIHQGKLHRMPQGLMLGVPTEVMPFARTGLLGPLGKARAALDLVLPRGHSEEDETLGGFLRRRLGSAVLEQIAEPLLAGIYAGDTDQLSLQATFPQFKAMEQRHRSLILGMIHSKKLQRAQAAKQPPAGRSGAMFLTYKQGLRTLIDALQEALSDVRVIAGQAVSEVSAAEPGVRLRLQDGAEMITDAAVITVPNFKASAMLGTLGAAASLIEIPYASVANVVLAYRHQDVARHLNAGSGFVVPRREGLTITACTVTSVKWLHTAPDDIAIIRCYVGRAGDDRGVTLSDDALIRAVREDVRRTMGIEAEPLFVEPTRWERAMPQYPVGHLERIGQFEKQLSAQLPGVIVTGSGFRGVGLPDCIAQGKEAAAKLIQSLD